MKLSPKLLLHWLIDYIYLAKAQAKVYLYKNPPKHYLGYIVEGKPPVILIPGLAEKWTFLKTLGDKISLKGYPVYILPELGNNSKDIPQSSKILKELIEKNNLNNVILITHSKGGIIGKYFLTYLNNDNRVKKLIAIASPFNGSKAAHIIPHKAFLELTPQSPIIKDLKSHKEVNSKIISLFPIFDNHIINEEGSVIDGGENIQINIHGHHKILFCKCLQDKVLELLETQS